MNSASFLLILAFLLLFSLKPVASGFEEKAHSDSHGSQINKKILKGIHLLYDERFGDAENVFLKIIAEFPQKPDGYFYMAMVSWSRLASGFWSPEVVNEFKKRIDRTVYVARRRIEDSNKPDSYDYFFLGGALGFKGRFELMKGNWLSSFFLAKDAIEALKTCLDMDPDNKDVMLGIGTFDYYTAHLSGVLKFLTYLLLHKGNKEEGLRKLQIAADEATYSVTEAKSMLLHIYLFVEQDFSKALDLAESLSKKYDMNPRFYSLKGVCYIRMKMVIRYRDTVYGLRQRSLRASSLDVASKWHRRALYLETVYDLYHGRYSEARSKLQEILNRADSENDPAMIAFPLVKMGMSYDLEGDREEAEKYYRRVMNMANGSGAQFLAKKMLAAPPEEKNPFIGY
ncbi:MAG: tetratricopeptide repeat protein [Deltaproteobacteria bacterium]|nr:tetratricopeptide repeat protein [Deltaproteobacteria bacterium]